MSNTFGYWKLSIKHRCEILVTLLLKKLFLIGLEMQDVHLIPSFKVANKYMSIDPLLYFVLIQQKIVLKCIENANLGKLESSMCLVSTRPIIGFFVQDCLIV